MEEKEVIENLSAAAADTIFIKDKEEPLSLTDKPDKDFSVATSFNNSGRNSRTSVEVGKNIWDEKWKVPLEDDEASPGQILFCKDRIIVYSDTQWQLFSSEGKKIASGGLGHSEVYMDKSNDVFYFSDYNGLVQARNLKDGSHRFSMFAMYGNSYRRSMFHTKDNFIYIFSIEQQEDPHGNHVRNSSVLELLDIGKPIVVDDKGYLESAHRMNTISFRSIDVVAASTNETWVAAAPGHIIIADKNLNIKKVLKEEFVPQAISLDQSGKIYLIVSTNDKDGTTKTSLWIITPDGERLMNLTLPDNPVERYFPAVIGYESNIFIPYGNKILSYNIKTKKLTEKIIEMPFGGACIDSKDLLVIASGKMIYTLNESGEINYLTHVENDKLTTNPVFIDSDHLICASDQFLYCFVRGQKIN